MSAIKQILQESRKRSDVDEFLKKELVRAGYGGVEIVKSPLGTRVTIFAVRPGLVVGRGGEMIRGLSRTLESRFKLFNPQIAVAEVDVPELNPNIMAAKIISALERGIHFRRGCYWALNGVMGAGALGCEIKISGKLTTERSRSEKFRAGYVPKAGDPVTKNARKAVVYTQLKPGLLGVKVTIIPPDFKSPDHMKIKEVEPSEAKAEAPTPTLTPTPTPQPPTEIPVETPPNPTDSTEPKKEETQPKPEEKGEAVEQKPEKAEGKEATPTTQPEPEKKEDKKDA